MMTYISTLLGTIVGIITSVEFISKRVSKMLDGRISNAIKEEIEPIKQELVEIKDTQRQIDIDATKNYLSKCFNDLRQGQKLTETNIERLYEAMEHYTNDLHCNSYMHKEFEALKKDGLL